MSDASKPKPKRSRFSRTSYFALPYLAYYLASHFVIHFVEPAPETAEWIMAVLYLTWAPASVPFVPFIPVIDGPTTERVVLEAILSILDIYIWAWLLACNFGWNDQQHDMQGKT